MPLLDRLGTPNRSTIMAHPPSYRGRGDCGLHLGGGDCRYQRRGSWRIIVAAATGAGRTAERGPGGTAEGATIMAHPPSYRGRGDCGLHLGGGDCRYQRRGSWRIIVAAATGAGRTAERGPGGTAEGATIMAHPPSYRGRGDCELHLGGGDCRYQRRRERDCLVAERAGGAAGGTLAGRNSARGNYHGPSTIVSRPRRL